MTIATVGQTAGRAVIPYAATTRRTREIDIKSAITVITAVSGTVVVNSAVAMFSSDSNNNWSVRLTFDISWTTVTTDAILIDVAGLVFDNAGRYIGVGSAYFNGPSLIMLDQAATDRFYVERGTSVTASYVAGTLIAYLTSEPTAYTIAANMENVVSADLYLPPASASASGIVDTSAQSYAGNKTLTGFTSLGGDVALKCKKLTGTSAAAENGTVYIAHGLNSTKIVGSSCILLYDATSGIGPEWVEVAGYQYHVSFSSSNFIIKNHATNSENILSKALLILVWYIE